MRVAGAAAVPVCAGILGGARGRPAVPARPALASSRRHVPFLSLKSSTACISGKVQPRVANVARTRRNHGEVTCANIPTLPRALLVTGIVTLLAGMTPGGRKAWGEVFAVMKGAKPKSAPASSAAQGGGVARTMAGSLGWLGLSTTAWFLQGVIPGSTGLMGLVYTAIIGMGILRAISVGWSLAAKDAASKGPRGAAGAGDASAAAGAPKVGPAVSAGLGALFGNPGEAVFAKRFPALAEEGMTYTTQAVVAQPGGAGRITGSFYLTPSSICFHGVMGKGSWAVPLKDVASLEPLSYAEGSPLSGFRVATGSGGAMEVTGTGGSQPGGGLYDIVHPVWSKCASAT